MAAAGLAEVLGGTPEQAENAAEIGVEHNLGLTCDPSAARADRASSANASLGDGDHGPDGDPGRREHKVSLDKAIKTMRETGADMKDK